ncbi:protein kinase [Phormidium sp. LEGE 05292]|uniref:protein kinase domain-containing protein n=1 Tax=[Phormidium] sp. LEGE 05292 TaxID=767427 RepID=UPI001882F57A|nr:protein kinase [Phormidium sp. LEGE 05292]MBE9227674.1 protein kinase [Phormidium sp. LEGE 05292]
MNSLQNLNQKQLDVQPHPPYRIIGKLTWQISLERTIYLAKITNSEKVVLLHKFSWSKTPSNLSWANIAAEIDNLLKLKHSGILPYLDSFVTASSFWLVQEYKQARPLNISNKLPAKEIKHIAISILEILIYLQSRNPAVVHQAIRPENILVKDKEVNLINFRLSLESVTGINQYFLAPEQLCNRFVTTTTDLYSLGFTLICLLAQTNQVKDLFDRHKRIKFQHLMPTDLSLRFIEWLYTMVQPNRHERYPNAAAALEALEGIEWKRLPEIRGVPQHLELKATQPQEILVQRFIITNGIPDTILKGSWRVGWHPNDPLCLPPNHAWISFKPASFEGNRVEFQVIVNTKLLRINQTYRRRLLLETNATTKLYTLILQVQTVKLTCKQLPILSLLWLLIVSIVAGWLGYSVVGLGLLISGGAVIGIMLGSMVGWGAEFSHPELMMSALRTSVSVSGLLLMGLGNAFGLTDGGFSSYLCGSILCGFFLGFVMGWVGLAVAVNVVRSHLKHRFSRFFALANTILCSGLGIVLGLGLQVGFLYPSIRFMLSFIAFPFALLLVSPLLTQAIFSFRYHLSWYFLIKR